MTEYQVGNVWFDEHSVGAFTQQFAPGSEQHTAAVDFMADHVVIRDDGMALDDGSSSAAQPNNNDSLSFGG